MKTNILIASALLLLSSTAFAVDGYTIKVGRDVNITAKTGAITSVALGSHVRSDINVGGIQVENTSVDIGRDYTSNVTTGAITAVALGEYASARVNVGGIQQSEKP